MENQEPTSADPVGGVAATEESSDPGAPARSHYVGFGGARAAFMGAVLALALVRVWLNPPLHPMLYWLLPSWYIFAAVFHMVQPRGGFPDWYQFLLRFSFFCYEIFVLAIIFHFLGGTGWLAILFLIFPAMEMSVAFPGKGAALTSVLAAVLAGGMAWAEASGWLWHDPFYSAGAPLYQEAPYVASVTVVALVFLVGLPAWAGHYARSRS
jgi:hypothetical protein